MAQQPRQRAVYPAHQSAGFYGTLTTAGNIFDRWKLVSGTVEITDAGLVLNGTMAQVLEHPLLSTSWTAMALTTEGVVEASYDNDAKTYTMTGEGQTFLAAYLSDRADQKPYVQEFGAWVINYPVRTYAEELAACQRYIIRLEAGSNYASFCNGYVISNGTWDVFCEVQFLVPMRAAPIVSFSGNIEIAGPDFSSIINSIVTDKISGVPGNIYRIRFLVLGDTDISGSKGEMISLRAKNDASAFINFDAQL